MDKRIDRALTEIERVSRDLQELSDAFWYLREGLEREGSQTKENFEEWKAYHFQVNRMSLYMSVYDVLTGNIPHLAEEIQSRSAELRAIMLSKTPPSM